LLAQFSQGLPGRRAGGRTVSANLARTTSGNSGSSPRSGAACMAGLPQRYGLPPILLGGAMA